MSFEKMVTLINDFDGTKYCVVTIEISYIVSLPVSTVPGISGEEVPRVITWRTEFVEKFLDDGWKRSEQIYIDEFSFNLWNHDRRRWNKVGDRYNVVMLQNRGPNIRLFMAIEDKGPIHFKLKTEYYNKESYAEFKLEESQNYYIIHDKASIHKDVSTGLIFHPIVHFLIQ